MEFIKEIKGRGILEFWVELIKCALFWYFQVNIDFYLFANYANRMKRTVGNNRLSTELNI